MTVTTFPAGPVTRSGAHRMLVGDEPMITYTSWDGVTRFHIAGPLAPTPGVADGIVMTGPMSGLSPGFDQIKIKTARQPGSTWMGTLYDELKAKVIVEAHARTPRGLSNVVSQWVGAWRPDQTGVLEWITPDRGYWYLRPRLGQAWPDEIRQLRDVGQQVTLTHQIEHDDPFWLGMPSFDTFAPGVSTASGFLTLANTGDQDASVQLLCYGPGTFGFSNGPSASTQTTISFGPLAGGQIALIDTTPRLMGVTDVTPPSPSIPTTPTTKLMAQVQNFVVNSNTAPLLESFESMFGVLPPQGSLYALLNGRFTNTFPGVAQPGAAVAQHMAVSIIGGNAASKVVARLDPRRRWPE